MGQAKLSKRYRQTQKILSKHKQEHVLRFWDELDEDVSVPALLMGIGDRARKPGA